MTPDTYTNKEFFIDVGHGHQVYVYDWGNPKGLPIIFLHGGPGAATRDRHKEGYDPKKHHVIFFDQRGCGKSLPYSSVEHNTLDDLLQDITAIADQVKFKQFVLAGRSWGSTIALAYAIKHPKRVKAMVLASIFTASKRELEWLGKGHFKNHFPEVWDTFLARTPKAHHSDPAAYHYKNILGSNDRLVHSSALAISELEQNIMTLDDRHAPIDAAMFDPTASRILAHYFTNNCFMPDRHILDKAHKLSMPVWLVHGRYDMDCPPITAYELGQKLPNSHLIWAISNHRNEHENDNIVRTIFLQLAERN